jgi:hypothetical protein
MLTNADTLVEHALISPLSHLQKFACAARHTRTFASGSLVLFCPRKIKLQVAEHRIDNPHFRIKVRSCVIDVLRRDATGNAKDTEEHEKQKRNFRLGDV